MPLTAFPLFFISFLLTAGLSLRKNSFSLQHFHFVLLSLITAGSAAIFFMLCFQVSISSGIFIFKSSALLLIPASLLYLIYCIYSFMKSGHSFRGFLCNKDIVVLFLIFVFGIAVYQKLSAHYLPGDSFVFMSQASRIEDSGFFHSSTPFSDIRDPRYSFSLLPQLLAMYSAESRILFFYRELPFIFLVISFCSFFLLCTYFSGKSRAVSCLPVLLIIFLGSSEIREYAMLNLPKVFIPSALYPCLLLFFFRKRIVPAACIFFLICFCHVYYAALLLIPLMIFSAVERFVLFRKNSDWKLLLFCLISVFFFYSIQGYSAGKKVNPFFTDWKNTHYAEKFIFHGRIMFLNPVEMLRKTGFSCENLFLSLSAYLFPILFFLRHRKSGDKNERLILFLSLTLLIVFSISFIPPLTSLFSRFTSPFKTVSVFQIYPFTLACCSYLLFFRKQFFFKHLSVLTFLLFVFLIFPLTDKNLKLPVSPFPEISSFMEKLNRPAVLSDELTSFYLSAFSGCDVYLSPAPFSSPFYDYKMAKQNFLKFMENPCPENLPEGITHIVVRGNLPEISGLIKECFHYSGMSVYQVIR